MTTEQKFNCIFCKDVFDSKEELQVHFRKHADPKFKSKNRFGVDSQVSNEKVNEKSEMVNCDVCSQMFPTISKAITHKHKVHPDHDVKYFCPWCGKLFTMKHPYNIHVQTSHEKHEQIEDKIFHCDCCDVDFFLPSAMIYHNKFFHRQDTDIPEVGASKKLRLYNQEVLQLYYCAFCGEEYENKVNLFKHVTDDHGDENQCPEEILRCPLCEAIFYHLDAYEIHLSFHSTDDLYSGNNELFADLLDFSLETLPPIIEKVENREDLDPEAQSQDTDVESAVNAVGIEKFLELAMDQTEDSNPGKVKKKKHKKSKKSAITLDEFLSMNQDVFGEGLDFQGVEEVPTRVVAKQFKSNKKSANVVASAELEKLKQKGIVVMKVASSKPTKIAQKKIVNKPTPNRELKTSSEVLTKLMNQSNNQIKIVKKSAVSVTKNNTTHGMQGTTTEETPASKQNAPANEIQATNESKEDLEIKNETISSDVKADTLSTEDNNENSPPPKTENIVSSTTPAKITPAISVDNNVTPLNDANNINKKSNSNNYSEQTSKKTVPRYSPELSENKDDTESSISMHDKEINKNNLDQENLDSETIDKDNIINKEKIEGTDAYIDVEQVTISDKNGIQPNASSLGTSLSTLKHLSHLTVKPVNQNKNISADISTDKISETQNDQKPHVKNEKEPSRLNVSTDNNNDSSPIKPKPVIDNDPTLDALRNLSKNITVKSLTTSTKRNIEATESDDDKETDTVIKKPSSNMKVKDVGGNKNFTIKKIKIEKNEPALCNKVINAVSNAMKNTKTVNKITTLASEIKSSKTSTDITQKSSMKNNTDILKHLPNITTKPLPVKKTAQSLVDIKHTNAPIKTIEATQKEAEIIEISDIDDSEDDTDNKEAEHKQDAPNSVDPLKNLSKHITIKSLNQPGQSLQKHIKVEKIEEQTDENHSPVFNSDDDMPANMKVCSQKLSSRNIAFKNALKNLSKNITVKSRTSSPSQSVKYQDHNSQESNVGANDDASDSDTETGKIKISEIENDNNNHDENLEDCDHEQELNKPIVESPHDSGSDNDELTERDFEAEIKATTLQRTNHEISADRNTMCLNNLKNISKSITVKSLNSNFSEKYDNTKIIQSQEGLEVMKNQSKPLAINPAQQVVKESPNDKVAKSRNLNLKKLGKIVDHTSNESLNQKVSVNKEVTVKTFQTKTVIQEITTTVTKTIKTVNQTVSKQEMRNSNQMNIPVLPQKVQGMKPSTSKNLQGVVIRHAAPVAAKPNNAVAQVRPVGTVVRPTKQVVPLRPGLNITRPSTPRMPCVKSNLPKSSPNKQVIGKPLKFSPSMMTSTIVKRPNSEEVSGPFSCFKKPKESLIPVSDVPTFGAGGESVVQVSAASHTSTTNYSSTSKIVKGNSVVTATQMKSEVTSMQQLSRLSNNTIGIKVKSAQVKQTQVQEAKSESIAMKRTTLEAIEKLQKQGLLVKKPRVELSESTDAEHSVDNVGYPSTDEQDE